MTTPTKTVETRYNPKFHYLPNDTIIGASLERYGEYAQTEIDFLCQYMDHRSTVYDVGANIGVHTAAFAHTGAEVYAWEANPRNFEILKMNCGGLGRAHLVPAAVGDGTEAIAIETYDPANPGNFGHMRIGADPHVLVPQVRLDHADAPDPDVIKIDVEGHEYPVLLGAVERIRRNRPLIYYEAQETLDFGRIFTFLSDLGYDMYWACVRNYNPRNFAGNPDNIFADSAIFSVVAMPDNLAPPSLPPVKGANDSWTRFCS